MTDVEFERCAAVLTSLHASHNLPHYLTAAGIIRHPSHVEVRYRGDLASFDSNELTRLVMAAHRWRVRVALSGRAKGVITVRLHPREATGTSIERHPSLADFQAQLAATTAVARINEAHPIARPPLDATDSEVQLVGSECDWGGCNDESVALRWSTKFAGYLPVCERHRGTLDSEGVCVRCGAPGPHCQCEDVSDDGHWWVAPSVGANNTEWTVCQRCGNVKRHDGKPSSTCRGPVRVGLRDEPSFGDVRGLPAFDPEVLDGAS